MDFGEKYDLLQLVYSLNLDNDVFESDLEEYYHYYRMVHVKHSERVINGFQLMFVKLPSLLLTLIIKRKWSACGCAI